MKHLGASYIDSSGRTAEEIVRRCALGDNLNIVIEASGAAETALQLISHLSRSSIYVMTGIPREGLLTQVDAAEIVRETVRKNQVIVGSVNSNRTHFEMALRDISAIDARFDGMLKEMITHRYRLDDFRRAFDERGPTHIKTAIEV